MSNTDYDIATIGRMNYQVREERQKRIQELCDLLGNDIKIVLLTEEDEVRVIAGRPDKKIDIDGVLHLIFKESEMDHHDSFSELLGI